MTVLGVNDGFGSEQWFWKWTTVLEVNNGFGNEQRFWGFKFTVMYTRCAIICYILYAPNIDYVLYQLESICLCTAYVEKDLKMPCRCHRGVFKFFWTIRKKNIAIKFLPKNNTGRLRRWWLHPHINMWLCTIETVILFT